MISPSGEYLLCLIGEEVCGEGGGATTNDPAHTEEAGEEADGGQAGLPGSVEGAGGAEGNPFAPSRDSSTKNWRVGWCQ